MTADSNRYARLDQLRAIFDRRSGFLRKQQVDEALAASSGLKLTRGLKKNLYRDLKFLVDEGYILEAKFHRNGDPVGVDEDAPRNAYTMWKRPEKREAQLHVATVLPPTIELIFPGDSGLVSSISQRDPRKLRPRNSAVEICLVCHHQKIFLDLSAAALPLTLEIGRSGDTISARVKESMRSVGVLCSSNRISRSHARITLGAFSSIVKLEVLSRTSTTCALKGNDAREFIESLTEIRRPSRSGDTTMDLVLDERMVWREMWNKGTKIESSNLDMPFALSLGSELYLAIS